MSEKERISTLSKVVGSTPEDQETVERHFAQQHEQPLVWKTEDHPEAVVEKSAEQVGLVKHLNVLVGDFVRTYGGTPMDFNPDRFVLFDLSKLPEDIQKKFVPGFAGGFSLAGEKITISIDRHVAMLQLARTMVHELLHAQSFHSVRATKDTPDTVTIFDRREGLTVRSRDKEDLLHKLNEAVTQELTERFDAAYFRKIPELEAWLDERRALRKSMDYPEGEPIAHSWQNKDGTWSARVFTQTTYKKERQYLNELLDTIQQAHSDQFADREAVFTLFARAYFSGRLLEIARLIESTGGPGAFRRTAEETRPQK